MPCTAYTFHVRRRRTALAAAVLLAISVPARVDDRTGRPAPLSLSLKLEAESALSAAAGFLARRQSANGSWASHPAVTSFAAVAFLNFRDSMGGGSSANLDMALNYLGECARHDGAIVNERTLQYAVQSTAIALPALVRNLRPSDLSTALKAHTFLLASQAGDGGFAMNGSAVPDLITTQYVVEALHMSRLGGLTPDPSETPVQAALDKASDYISRCQIADHEGKSPDPETIGSFLATPPDVAGTVTFPGMPRSPTFLTVCGLRAMLHAGRAPSSDAVRQAVAWLEANAGFDENPGCGETGYYTYILGLAKTLRTCELAGVDFSAAPRLRNWRDTLVRELMNRQNGLGTWRPGKAEWWENNPELVSAYVMFALVNAML